MTEELNAATPNQPEDQKIDPKHQTIEGAGRLGLIIFIASLGMLFVSSIVGYLIVRSRAEEWPPAGMSGLPSGLWSSTLIILACSWTIEMALRAIRADDPKKSLRYLWLTYGLGWLFLIFQTVGWINLVLLEVFAVPNLYAFTFFMLTGLHAAHVIGGLISLTVVLLRARKGAYSADYHPGIEYNQMYWHFLDGVWVVMFVILLVTN